MLKSGYQLKWDCVCIFSNFKNLNLCIDLDVELCASAIALYDADTVSPVRVEIWKENNFLFFKFFIIFSIVFIFFTASHLQTKKMNHNCIENQIEKP